VILPTLKCGNVLIVSDLLTQWDDEEMMVAGKCWVGGGLSVEISGEGGPVVASSDADIPPSGDKSASVACQLRERGRYSQDPCARRFRPASGICP
jgi:hypothetical protein